jgi:hypothetical protein
MTQTHPITPPPELVQQWCHEDGDEIKTSPRWFHSVCAKAAQWGAGQELEACCEWLVSEGWFKYEHEAVEDLRAARRPKPPSLKEQAMRVLVENGTNLDGRMELDSADIETIRRALETLPND